MDAFDDNLKPTSKAARLRHYWPQIERLLVDGVSHAAIVAALKKTGIDVSLGAFRVYLFQQRKKSKTQAAGANVTPRFPVLPPETGGATPAQATGKPCAAVLNLQDATNPLTRKQRRDAHAAQYINHEQSHPLLQRRKEHDS